jgi:hypothetical protein
MIHATITADRSDTDSRRRDQRVEAEADVSLRPLGETAVDAILLNISSLGFMAATDAQIAPGSRVWVMLPGVNRINALVIWARNGRLGCEFAAPIDPLLVLQAIGTAG